MGIVINFDKSTKTFDIHHVGSLKDEHIMILHKFLINNDIPLDELVGRDSDMFQYSLKYVELVEWGFLKDVFDHVQNKTFVNITPIGSALLKNFLV